MSMSNDELAMLIKQGKTEYYIPLWERTEKLINMLIRKRTKGRKLYHTIEIDDLMQCGYFALITAVRYYNPDKPFKFNTYLKYSVYYVIDKQLSISESDIANCVMSLNTPLHTEDEDLTLLDCLPDDTAVNSATVYENSDTRRIINDVLSQITDIRMRDIVYDYYFNFMTYKQIAIKWHITEERVRQIKNRALYLLSCNKQIQALK